MMVSRGRLASRAALLVAGSGLVLALGCGSGSGSSTAAAASSTPPPATPANPTGWTGALPLETSLTLASTAPTVAMDEGGNILAAWQKAATTTSNAVWGSEFLAPSTWSADTSLSSLTGSSADIQVASAGTGTFLSAWDVTTDAKTYSVYSNFTTVANGAGTPTLISTGNSFSPSVAMNASGAASAVWMEEGTTYAQVMVAQYNPTTQTWSAPQALSTTTTADALYPKVAMDPAGDVAVVWAEGVYSSTSGGTYVVHVATYTPAAGWSAPMTPQVGAMAGSYALAMSAAGARVAWSESADSGSTYVIRASSWNATAGTWSAAAQVSASGGVALQPALAQDAQGNALLTWSTGTNGSYAATALYSATCTPTGTWTTSPQTILANELGVDNPSLVMNATGTAVLAFNRYDGTNWRTAAISYAPGTGWASPLYIQTATSGDAYAPVVSMNTAGQAMVVWYQADAASLTHIYGNRFN